MSSTKPEKAVIRNLDDGDEQPIEVLFNPNEYTFSKKNTWTKTEVIGKNVPQLEFGGGDSMGLKMQLFFDTSLYKQAMLRHLSYLESTSFQAAMLSYQEVLILL